MGQFATNSGDATESVRIVSAARDRLPRSAPAIAGIWMDAIEALALAQVRDRNALTMLDQAEFRLSRASNDEPIWPWIFGSMSERSPVSVRKWPGDSEESRLRSGHWKWPTIRSRHQSPKR